MEMGFGFLVGILGGGILAVIVAVIVAASRRALRRAPPGTAVRTQTEPHPPAARRKTSGVVASGEIGERRSGNTMILPALDSHEEQLNKNIQDVRDLLFRLVDVISSTESASGVAASAFQTAREAIQHINLNASSDLAEAQAALIFEIDRVVKSNAKLHSELESANKGIAEQRRIIEELRVEARIDALTKIPNRAAFNERLDEYLSLLERTNLVFSLMILDIDHFKKVNDTHGHVNGDRILAGVAAKISQTVRTNDFAARYGGEEFAVIFPGTAADDALVVAERIRREVEKTKFRLDEEIIKITISGGLAEAEKGLDQAAVIANADGALYRAKEGGRNQVLTQNGGDSRNVDRL